MLAFLGSSSSSSSRHCLLCCGICLPGSLLLCLPLPFLLLGPLGGCFCLRLEPGSLLSCQSLPLLLFYFVQLPGKALLFLALLLLVARLGGSRLIHVCLQLPHCG